MALVFEPSLCGGKGNEATMTVPEKGTSGRPRRRLKFSSATANPA